jgi:hypothetical protein
MPVSNADIVNFLLANPGMSDADIASNMATYGVSPAQMAAATGTSEGEIIARAAATVAPGSSITLGNVSIVPEYRTTGSGENQEIGALERVYVSQTTGDPNYRAPVGSTYQQYNADGTFERTGVTQKVDSGLKEIVALASAYFLPVIGAEIAATLGVSATTGTAIANAALQVAQGTPIDKILENTLMSYLTSNQCANWCAPRKLTNL